MKNRLLISESEKERILGLHKKLIKESLLNEQKFEDAFASNINNYPECIQQMGKPKKVINVDFSNYAIFGTGELANFVFFPKTQLGLPRVFNPQNNKDFERYACKKNNQVKIGPKEVNGDIPEISTTKTYTIKTPSKRTVPKKPEDLLAGKYAMKGDKDTGNDGLIKQIQTQLIYAGESPSSAGIFDQQTKDAVISFQTKNSLKHDGIVGKNTWGKLSQVKLSSPELIAKKEITQIDAGAPEKQLAMPNQTQTATGNEISANAPK
jgi:hypothetical protein